MFGLIALIIGAVMSFASGSAGMGGPVTPQSASVPVQTTVNAACYNPQPGVKITLKWPDSFVNLSDNRPTQYPTYWANQNLPAKFNSSPECQNIVMNNLATRTFILVRENTRIPDCKTDELAGPYGIGVCPGWESYTVQDLHNRGACTIDGFESLRKIAETKDQNGQMVEIFWNPFSYNVGCNYKQDENCGYGTRRNINLKDFIYVIKKRDAIDPDRLRAGCPVRWDAGATNEEACSHYFDIYIAEDFYNAANNAAASDDQENPYYFVKQVIQNCTEQVSFLPAPEANLTMPPLFLKSPFIWQNDKTIYTNNKIVPLGNQENLNYNVYVWTFPNIFYDTQTASTINLLRSPTDEVTGPLKLCKNSGLVTLANGTAITITPTPPPNKNFKNFEDCYDSLGNIFLKNDKGQNTKFTAYSKFSTPQTFTLVKSDDPSKGYVYTITNKSYPENSRNDKSIQFRAMQMITKNSWTWATPGCKPAIYLYPKTPTYMNVKIQLDGQMTVSKPGYDSQNGWSVLALPNGQLTQPLTLANYPYLYYETLLKGITLPKEGFVYSKTDLPKSLKSLMKDIGFNEKEISDFMAYWLPRLTEKPYYFVTLLPEDVINQKEKLTFSVSPDTLIRSRFVFEGLDAPISVKPLTNIQSHQRDGFTVTDWGGTIVGKSCTDVSVK